MTTINQNAPRRSFQRVFARALNCLTILLLLGVACMAVTFFLVYLNPYLTINPFPPPTLPSTAFVPTPTVTNPLNLPPTWTATNIPPPTATDTPRPTIRVTLPTTPFSLVTPTITLTETRPPAGYPYNIQTGSPYAIANLYYPDKGCNWMGVGGQVVDMSGAPVTGLIIKLGGSLPGIQLPRPMLSLTGVALNYGQSGYEFTLAERPIASRNSLWLQLLDQAGIPLSDKFYFNTFDTCDKNLIIVNFKQVR